MDVALITVYSHDRCTLKDVAGGYGTVFHIGSSLPARVLQRAKSRLAHLPAPVMGYLAAQLRRAGHRVTAHELKRGSAGQDPLPECDVALVLTSMVDATAEREVLSSLGARGVHTVAFGALASMRPELYASAADVVVRGEPEALGGRLADRSLEGVVDAGFLADLDALPFPDWTGFPIESYRYALLSRKGPTLPVSGARGCAFGCGYCPFRATSQFRQRRIRNVSEEIRRMKYEHGVTAVAFRDPLFNFDRDRVMRLADQLSPLDVSFSAEMRADRIDEEMLRALGDAGLRSLEIGIESIDRGMLEREKRNPPSQGQIERVVDMAHDLGIRVIGNFMLGLPDDTEASIRSTVAWAKQLNTFAVQFTIATPYPGTSLEKRVGDQLLRRGPDAFTGWEPLFDHPDLSPSRLRELREWAYVSYHARPQYLLRVARHSVRAFMD